MIILISLKLIYLYAKGGVSNTVVSSDVVVCSAALVMLKLKVLLL
jgi:hypothetical protein